MVSLDRKGKMAIAFLVSLIIVAVSIIVIFFVIKPLPEGVVNKVTLCQITNTIKGSTLITRTTLPVTCLPTIVNEPLSGSEEEIMEKMAGFMRDCWTMWLKGKKDFRFWKIDWVQTCYIFKIEDKNISIEDFIYYLQTHWNGKKSDKNTYWNYIEEAGGSKSICFDPRLKDEGFKRDEKYYIRFRDDRQGKRNDQILVSNNQNFRGNYPEDEALGLGGVGEYCVKIVS